MIKNELIVSDIDRKEVGYIQTEKKFDLDIGDTNDFELTLSLDDWGKSEYGQEFYVYADQTEYGGLAKNIDIEIETRSFDEIQQVLEIGGVKRIMLDNFSVDDTRKAVRLIAGRFEVESSGGITLDTIRGYAETGVDFISVGALTHQIKSLDMNLKKV